MVFLIPLLLLQSSAQRVTVTFPPTPLPKALEILSKASGKKLDFVPALADEVVLAQLKDADIDTALNHLAEALCARWLSRPNGLLRLSQDPDAERRVQEAKDAARVKDFYDGIAYIKKRLAEQPTELDLEAVKATAAKVALQKKRAEIAMANDDREHMFLGGGAEEEEPVWRAAGQLTLLYDPKTLLSIPYHAREVWAENPTPMQHPLPEGAEAILARYRREFHLTKPKVVVTRIKVTVESEGGELYVQLSATDSSGAVVDRTMIRASSALNWLKLPWSQNPHYVAPGTDSPVQVSNQAREIRIALASTIVNKNQTQASMVAKHRSEFLDPVKFEPTQWHAGEDLILAARATNKNLIGTVSDVIDGKFYFAGSVNANNLKPTPSHILGKHRLDLLPTTDGWLVVRPVEDQFRWSRFKAKAYFGEGVRNGGITVADAAEFVSHSTDENPVYSWVWDYSQVLFSGPGSFQSGWDGRSLKLWASIGQGNINTLLSGGTLQIAALPQDAQTKIEQGVYWHQWLDDPVGPTDKFPNGITDGTLTMTVKESTVLHGAPSGGDPSAMTDSITPENIGVSQAKKELTYRNFERWQIGVHRTYDLHFILNPGKVPMTISLEETLFDPNRKVVSELPDSVMAEVEKARKYAVAHPQPAGEYPSRQATKGIPPP